MLSSRLKLSVNVLTNLFWSSSNIHNHTFLSCHSNATGCSTKTFDVCKSPSLNSCASSSCCVAASCMAGVSSSLMFAPAPPTVSSSSSSSTGCFLRKGCFSALRLGRLGGVCSSAAAVIGVSGTATLCGCASSLSCC